MKRRLLTSLFIIFAFASTSVYSTQKYYTYDSQEYQLVQLLSNVSGSVGPGIVTPISGDSLLKTLKNIDVNKIPANARDSYRYVLEKLTEPDSIFNFSDFKGNIKTDISLEAYMQTEDEPAALPIYLIYPYKDRLSLFNLQAEMLWNNYVYGKASFDIKTFIKWNSGYLTSHFLTNIPLEGYSVQLMSPFDSGISVGTDWINLFLGRSRLNIGNGKTGNMFIADNFNYQDFAKLSLDSDYFDYDLTFTHFDTQTDSTHLQEWMRFDEDHQLRISHTYSANILNKVRLSFHEGIMIFSGSSFDFRMINPFIFMHNWQGFYESVNWWGNNFVALELNANLGLGLTMDIQFIADQIQLSSEVDAGNKESILPNAYGILGNLSHTVALKHGFLENYIEGVYTMPSLYLNNLPGEYSDKYYNYDLIVGYYMLGEFDDISYTGYKYGPDTAVLSLGGKYTDYLGKFNVGYNALFRAHGQNGIKWYSSQDDKADIGIDNLWRFALTGTVEYMLQMSVSGKYQITPHISIQGILGYQTFWNFQNIENERYDNLQCSIGFTFTPTAFIPTIK